MRKNIGSVSLFLVTVFTVFIVASFAINSVIASPVQDNAKVYTEYMQVYNANGSKLSAGQAVVFDSTEVCTNGKFGVKTTTTADNPMFAGYVKSDIGTGEIGLICIRGVVHGISAGAITEGAAVGTTATAGKVDAGTYGGVCLDGASGANEDIVIYLK